MEFSISLEVLLFFRCCISVVSRTPPTGLTDKVESKVRDFHIGGRQRCGLGRWLKWLKSWLIKAGIRQKTVEIKIIVNVTERLGNEQMKERDENERRFFICAYFHPHKTTDRNVDRMAFYSTLKRTMRFFIIFNWLCCIYNNNIKLGQSEKEWGCNWWEEFHRNTSS